MFELLKSNPAVSLLKEDHDRVKRLFDQFEAAKGKPVLTEAKYRKPLRHNAFRCKACNGSGRS